jgi:hypothetical protein
MKTLLAFLFFLLSTSSFGQSDAEYWNRWKTNYPLVDIIKILEYEKHYADSVEKHPTIPPYYARSAKYRFKSQYIGIVRPLDKSILASMKTVYKIFIGNPNFMDNLFASEVLIKLGSDTIWMPVQKQILEALNQEIKKGDTLTLYCLYLNEHSVNNGLRNIFLISEFSK